MEQDRVLTFAPVDHPDPRVRRVGFEIADPYVEQCWSAVIGPSATRLLRRLPVLWMVQAPARIEHTELARSLGLGGGVGPNSRLTATLDRLVRFGMARPTGDGLDVYLQVAPLRPRQLERLPQWTRATHDRLFTTRLEDLDERSQHQTRIDALSARFDRMQQPSVASGPPAVARHGTLGR